MKRYEFLVKREKAVQRQAKCEAESLTNWVYLEHQKGVLSPECYYSLLDQMNEATEREWEAASRVARTESNLRRSHVSYCKARLSTTRRSVSFLTWRESLAQLAELPRVVTDVHSPELELIANSLPSHAPPQELASITETLSS